MELLNVYKGECTEVMYRGGRTIIKFSEIYFTTLGRRIHGVPTPIHGKIKGGRVPSLKVYKVNLF